MADIQSTTTSNDTPRFVSRLTRETLAVVLAGGRGTRLQELTEWRAKPAVPFGGKFRIIDFTLSNCLNSGIRRLAVITQYRPYSLIRHIQNGWNFLRGEFGEFIELYPAFQYGDKSSWYAGTADAVYQNRDILRSHGPAYVLVLAGDHVYKMDYGPMLASHVEKGADMTVGCIEVALADARGFGVMTVNTESRVIDFREKPSDPQPMPGSTDTALASMGIYVFNTEFLLERLAEDTDRAGSSHDFGKDIIPSIFESYHVVAYPLQSMQPGRRAYWRDVGTVDAFWKANMELLEVTPELNLYDQEWPVWTYQEQLPPAKFVFDDDGCRGMAVDSMVSGGCIVSGAELRRSLLFSDVRIETGTHLEETVVLPHVRIGKNCSITKAIIDTRCVVPDGTVVSRDANADEKRFTVTEDGVTLVTPEMLGQHVHRVR